MHISVGLRTLTDKKSYCPIDLSMSGHCVRLICYLSGPVSDYYTLVADTARRLDLVGPFCALNFQSVGKKVAK